MRRQILCNCIVLSLSLLMLTPAFAKDAASVFVQKCGICHNKGGNAAPVNPADKAGIVWRKYFYRGRHPVDLSTQVSNDEMSIILGFLQEHAADSDHPVAAVIPK